MLNVMHHLCVENFCPCVNCANGRRQSLNHIRTHFICHGIIPNYKKCIWHGELADGPTIFHAKPVNVDMGHRIEDIIHDLGQHGFVGSSGLGIIKKGELN